MTPQTLRNLPRALDDDGLRNRLAGRRPAVFLDYDGVLTPIVDRPEDALIAGGMRDTVRALARRCPVCVVSGRDRQVVQELMGIDDLVVAGSHGFDIWSATAGAVTHDASSGYEDLVAETTDRLRAGVATIPGRRRRAEARIGGCALPTARTGAARPCRRCGRRGACPATGRAQDHPRQDGLRAPTEDRLEQGPSGRPDDPEMAFRGTAADLSLASPAEVQRLLSTLAR